MTNEAQLRVVASFIVSDCMNKGALGIQSQGGTWTLNYPIAGLAENTAYATREEMIGKVTDAYVAWLKKVGSLQVAS